MSYFDFFFNEKRVKTLRGYTRPLNLTVCPPEWMWSEAGIARITHRLYALKMVPLVPEGAVSRLSLVDERTYRSSTLATDFKWIYGVRNGK